MDRKEILFVVILYILFGISAIAISFMGNETPIDIWMIIFIILGIAILLWIIASFIKIPEKSREKLLKNQPKAIKIIEIIFIILIVYEIITMQDLRITWLILFLLLVIPFFGWFFKKEE